jgi:RNA polymerase sigma-70 factor (ECF subfamily)
VLADLETDDALMQRFCAGDEAAFGQLYDRYAAEVLSFLTRLVRDPALAEDVLQTAFLSLVRARDRYHPSAGVRAWIFAIAANAGRDALRRRKSRREDLMGDEPLVRHAGAAVSSDPMMGHTLEQALAQLPDDQREAVLLHKLQGLSFPEIAAALGTTAGAARLRAHRGYERLKQLLVNLGSTA